MELMSASDSVEFFDSAKIRQYNLPIPNIEIIAAVEIFRLSLDDQHNRKYRTMARCV